MALYRPLSEISISDTAEFGGKAARLGEAMRLGCPVLGGVALSAELYRRFMRQGGLQGEIRSILTTMQPQSIGQFQAAEWAIRAAFDVRRVPEDVVAVIHQVWGELGAERVAVRSSATSEDSPHQSFVGQHTSILDVADPDAAVNAVLACWTSLFSAQALSYAHSFGVDLLSSAMGVLMQPMVDATAQGALFTVDPVTGDADRFLLSVQGGQHAGLHMLDPYATLADVPPAWRQLRDIGLLLDEHEQTYQSLDWTLVGDQVYLLRARPVTGAPTFLPPQALESIANGGELVWLHEPDVTPRAAQPQSWYQQSRGPSLQKAHRARAPWPVPSPNALRICYPCGYLYASPTPERAPAVPVEPLHRWFQDLRLLLRARSLDQGYLALRERSLERLRRLNQRALSELDRAELAGTLAEIMTLHKAFREESGLLQRVDRALTQRLDRVHRRWLTDAEYDLDLLLWTGEDAWSQAEYRLAKLASTRYARQEEREFALQTYFAQHRHHFVPGDIWAPWRDLTSMLPSQDLLEEALAEHADEKASEEEMRLEAQGNAVDEILARLGRLRGKAYTWLLRLAQRYRTLALDSREPVALCCVLECELVNEVGRRLHAAGLAECDAHGRLLTCREILDWLRATVADAETRATLQERQATLRRWARYAPPERLEPRPDAGPQREDSRDQRFRGRAVCAGQVSGRARVVRSAAEASQVLPGEILVCQVLPFELTPLFSIASAVVAEEGDLLDHASVLAREYGVPAVFGVQEATRRIETGDTLEVDATRGIVVRRLPEPDWEMWAI
jgi:rifampicin phosphotransferase